ncbi:MAG: BMP family ABC transporter substrate-binding protein [Eubacterium sp.]|nr:BMP family ABC transporter substrate-binding protein [Candidatus Colimonas fimequi]
MRKLALLFAFVMVMALTFTSCGQSAPAQEEDLPTEIAMIIDGETVNDGSFNQVTWESIKKYCSEKNIGCSYYDAQKPTKDVYLEAIDHAVEDGNKLIVMSGVQFEETVFEAQAKYEDTYFLLIDGLPHDSNDNYEAGSNTIGVLFSEEEAGYLAGFAAVADGYKNIGFMGGMEVPSVQRYGYGFVQGASDAADQLNVDVKVQYAYSGTFSADENVQNDVEEWYKNGTEVVFACGGNMNRSVIAAAENHHGKVIGVDTDQSGLSETIITSAEKNLGEAVENVLKNYARGSFGGGSAFNYGARNDGVALEMVNARFNTFSGDQYDQVLSKLKEGDIKLKKDTDVESVKELAGKHVKLQ